MTSESSPTNATGNRPALTAVVACTQAGVIGLEGGMPWKLGSDLRRFKSLTTGGTLIMGRKTYESIGKPLPGRETIVLSRSCPPVAEPRDKPNSSQDNGKRENLTRENAAPHWADSVAAALELAQDIGRPCYVVGGAEIYRLLIGECENLWVTRVWSNVAGDTTMDLDTSSFRLIETLRVPQTERDSVPTEFQFWRRKNSVPKSQMSH